MNVSRELDRIALADLSAHDMRVLLVSFFEAGLGTERDFWAKLAASMRAWTWKTLTGRQADRELEDWHEILSRLASRVSRIDERIAVRFEQLAELIYESISSAEISDPKFVLQRSHTKRMLSLLAVAPQGRMERAELGRQLKLQQANLTRIINMMVAAGLVTKSSEGKNVIVEVTRAGEREGHTMLRVTPRAERNAMVVQSVNELLRTLDDDLGHRHSAHQAARTIQRTVQRSYVARRAPVATVTVHSAQLFRPKLTLGNEPRVYENTFIGVPLFDEDGDLDTGVKADQLNWMYQVHAHD